MPEPFSEHLGCEVVVDTHAANLVYLGRLERISKESLCLKSADVHDLAESRTLREVYVMESKKLGIRANRKEVTIRMEEVVSISRLEDIVVY